MKDFIKAGTDVRNLRKPLNELARRVPREIITEGAVSNYDGDRLSFSALGEELYWIRLESKTGTTPIKYAFTVMQHDRTADTWIASPITGSTSDNTYAVELNNASVTTGDGKRFRARVDQSSGRWIFDQGGGGGLTGDIRGKDILLVPLGTYDEYKDCPDVPPDPPKHADNTFCEPPYAWAAYKICGYKFSKVGDMRGFGVWAHELNGGTISAWRRLHPAVWGWDSYTDGQPTGDEACAGVRLFSTGASALSCACPDWLQAVTCMKLMFKTIPRPCPTDPNCGYECGTLWYYMDGNGGSFPALWDTEFSLVLCKGIGGCSFNLESEHWSIEFDFEEIPRGYPDCYWGPEEIDPCDPCEGWTRFFMKITGNWAGNNQGNCPALGLVTAYFRGSELQNALENCTDALPYDLKECNQCDTVPNTSNYLHIIDPDSIKVTCCSAEDELTCP